MGSFFSRLHNAYELACDELALLKRDALLTHHDLLVELVYAKALPKFTSKVVYMLKNELDYDEKDLTLEVVRKLYLLAAKRLHRKFDAITKLAPSPDGKKKKKKTGGAPPPRDPFGASSLWGSRSANPAAAPDTGGGWRHAYR